MFSAHAHINVTTITHFDQNLCVGCLLALYGSTMHLAQLRGVFRTIFFCLVCGLLEKKKYSQLSRSGSDECRNGVQSRSQYCLSNGPVRDRSPAVSRPPFPQDQDRDYCTHSNYPNGQK